jgi:hypothetical protein
VLTARLRKLEEAGVIERRRYSEHHRGSSVAEPAMVAASSASAAAFQALRIQRPSTTGCASVAAPRPPVLVAAERTPGRALG